MTPQRIEIVNRQYTPNNCQPSPECPKICRPGCGSNFTCIYQTVTECGVCPEVQCIPNSLLAGSIDRSPSESVDSNNNANASNKDQTALIAGLTTGIVVIALILATIAGVVFFRRRKTQNSYEEEKQLPPRMIKDDLRNRASIAFPPTALSSISETSVEDAVPPWSQTAEYVDHTHPQSPIIIGAQSLQIPHLDTPITPTECVIRRSLNLQSAIPTVPSDVYRSSSVRVTKNDYNRILANKTTCPSFTDSSLDDDDADIPTLRRAISVKKNNSTHSHSSSVTRIGSVTSDDAKIMCAKPTLVRINTEVVTRKEGGMTKNASIRKIVPEHNPRASLRQSNSSLSVNYHTEDNIHLFYPPQPKRTNTSQMSLNSNTSADGEITVYLESNPP